jgi:predicted ester cyclase
MPWPSENEIDLAPERLSRRKYIVRVFYKELWDKGDLSLVPQIFHDGFTFRGSLGPGLTGYEQFGSYVTWLRQTLENYTSDILALVEEGDCVAGKLRFHGLHRQPLFGEPVTGARVWWYGAPLFTFDGDRVRDLWVLGDIHGLRSRLGIAGDTSLRFETADQEGS